MATFIPNVTDKFADPALYTPNFGFLDTMLRRRQSMYDAGFAQVNAQNSILNRNLTHAANQEARDQFVRSAQEQLKNLSSLDLSQQQNVQNALQVYQPFYKNTRILGDMAFTAHMDQQENIAETFRLKDGGKDFSQANLDYVRMQREEFRNDSPENVGYYLNNKRSFTPYKDYKKKFLEAYEKFKPSVKDVEYVDGQYIRGKRDASVHSYEFKKFLESYLDEQDLKQIEIEGVVKYGRSNEALIQGYAQKANQDSKVIDQKIDFLQNQLKIASTKEEKEQIADQIKTYASTKNQIANNLQALATADPAQIKKVRDSIAKELHYDQVVGDFAAASERSDIKTTVEVNSAWVTMYTQSQINARQKDQQQFDLYKIDYEARVKNQGKTMGGALSGNSVELNAAGAETYNAGSLESELLAAKMGITEASKTIASHLYATGKPSDEASVKAFIQKFATLQNDMVPQVDKNGNIVGYNSRSTGKPVDPKLISDFNKWQEYTRATAPLNMTINNLEASKKQLEAKVAEQTKGDTNLINAAVASILPKQKINITTKDGKRISLTAKEIYDGITTGSMKVVDDSYRSGYVDSSMFGGTPKLLVNGTKIDLSLPSTSILKQVVDKVNDIKNSANAERIKATRDKIYTSEIISNPRLATFNTDSDFYKSTQGELQQRLGKEVIIRGVDPLSGRVAFSLTAKDKSTQEDIINKAGGRSNITYDETNDLYYVTGINGTNVMDQLSGMEKAIYQSAASPIKGKQLDRGVHSLESAPFKIGNLPYDFQWKRISRETAGVNGTKEINYEYFLYDGANNAQPIFSTPARDPMQLIEDIRKLGNNPGRAVQLMESLK